MGNSNPPPSTPTGFASGDLAGSYPGPTVTQARGLRETAGPTTLAMGAVADGAFLKRSGTTTIGQAPDAAAGTASARTLSNTGTTACAGNDARLSDSRAPSGAAGGDLGGSYPNPTTVGESATVPLAKLTGGGANGSLTFTRGQLTAHVDPT